MAHGKHIKVNQTLNELKEKLVVPENWGKLSSSSSASATRLVLSDVPAENETFMVCVLVVYPGSCGVSFSGFQFGSYGSDFACF